MSDLVGNPNCRFSHAKAHIIVNKCTGMYKQGQTAQTAFYLNLAFFPSIDHNIMLLIK